jgi:hypothetical protein
VFKPLYGESMAKDYPELTGGIKAETPAPAPTAPTASLLPAR